MDADHFDSLTRSLVTRSRRGILSALAAVIGGAVIEDEALAKRKRAKQRKRGQDRAQASDERVAAEKRKKKKKKKKGSTPTATVPPTGSGTVPPAPPCPRGQTLCGGACVDLMTDAANCGRCDRRCQLYGVCSNGTCRCTNDCSNSEATCCPQGFCICAGPPHYWIHAGHCQGVGELGPISSCPADTTPCTGPRCRACCPSNSTCDPSTGTCLCDPAAGNCRQFGQCPPGADYCTSGSGTCGNGGFCLQPFDGGATRCGRHDGSDGRMCGCTSHQECETRTGHAGAFCAKISGSNCRCRFTPQAGDTTFCVSPR